MAEAYGYYDLSNPNDSEEVRKILMARWGDDEDDGTSYDLEGESGSSEEDNIEIRENSDNTDTSLSGGSSEEDNDNNEISNYFVGRKAPIIWKKTTASKSTKTKTRNIIISEVKECAQGAKSEYEAWNCLFTNEMLNMILTYTNKYISTVKTKYARDRDAKEISMCELKAFIGLLYLAGVLKSNRQRLSDLWSNDGMGVEMFRLGMPINRFKFILRCLRFDDKASHEYKKKTDKLAAVREIFSMFVDNCKKCYSLGKNVTIDEKIEAFRGRCSFKQYIPSKSRKCGIKIFALVDAKTLYTSNLEIYSGKQPDGPFAVSYNPTDVVKRLTCHIYKTGRNITADSWFTDFHLIQDLKKETLTYVGTVRKNNSQIPVAFVSTKNRDVKSSLFGFNEDVTLVSYIPKKRKNVILMSSIHTEGKIDEKTRDTKKPEILTFYEETKSSVDLVDHIINKKKKARNSQRWPMVIFYTMLNIAGINSQIIYLGNKKLTASRRDFLKNLAKSLLSEHLQKRADDNRGRPIYLQKNLEKFKSSESQVPESQTASSSETRKRKHCEPCKEVSKRRLTKYSCHKCGCVPLCLEHALMVCQRCFLEKDREIVHHFLLSDDHLE